MHNRTQANIRQDFEKQSIPASVGVLTYNSSKTLERCLRSLGRFSEIIVCDGGSNDETLTIAGKFGAKIIAQEASYKNADNTIADFSGVRNQMLEAAQYGWFLFVDSDEYLSEEVAEEIGHISKESLHKKSALAYWMPRKRTYNGDIVQCSTTYPNRQMRFFHKNGVTRFIKEVHERINVRPSTKIGHLKHPEYVPFEHTKQEWKKKLLYYIEIEVTRHTNQTFSQWLRLVFGSGKASFLYALRYVWMILFCHGHRMPRWYELLQYWYHWQLITKTGKKYFSRAFRDKAYVGKE